MTAAPVDALTPPVAVAPIPDLVNNILGGKQYISPSYWVGWVMEKVCGVNPWGWIAEQFAGDWNAAAEASDALNNLAEFNTRYAATVREQTKALIPDHWDGNAAEQASAYFTSVAATLQEQVAALQGVASQFHSLAAGMEEMAQALIAQAIKLWYLILDAHDAAWAAVQAFTGLTAGYLGALHGMESHPLPRAAYDYPGA